MAKSKSKSNLADGRNSADMEVGGDLVAFINRNVTPYPTEVGAPAFDLIPIEKQKDIMVNVSRMHGQQEYDRVMVSWLCCNNRPNRYDAGLKSLIGCMPPNTVSRYIMDSAIGWHMTCATAEPC